MGARTDIRTALITALNTIDGYRILDHIGAPLDTNMLPALVVSWGDEVFSEGIIQELNQPCIYDADIEVTAYQAGSSLGLFREEAIESVKALLTDHTLGGTCINARYTSTSKSINASEGDTPYTQFVIKIEVQFDG